MVKAEWQEQGYGHTGRGDGVIRQIGHGIRKARQEWR